MLKIRYFKNFQITTKFVLWFLIIALLPLAIATYMSYYNSRKILEEEATSRLFAVADNKANQIEAYLREKRRNVTQLSLTSDLTDAVEKFEEAFDIGGINSPEYRAVDQKFSPFLTYYQRLFGYNDLFLVSTDGRVIFSTKKEKFTKSLFEIALRKDSELANVFVKIVESFPFKTEISNFEYDPKTDKAIVFIAVPILSGGDLIGAIIAQMDNQGIAELVQDYTGLGRTGETVIGTKIGNEVVVITPLRFDPEATFKRRIVMGSERGLYLQKAVEGRSASGASIDYRGKEILTICNYLPSFQLGMIVKMDTAEIFASANRLRNTLVVISLALLMLVVIMAILIARSVSGPIKELTRVSGIITQGNLLERAHINTEDEIGELAHSFNHMTDRLVEAKANVEQEKAKVEEQKELLEKANQELDSFVYTASHDLRAPLRAISSFSSFLEEDYKGKLDKDGKGHLSEIRKGANRMTELIDDLLTLSRISRIENPYEDVNINDLIDSVIERIKLDIREKRIDLKIQKDMPVVRCDRIKMAEVFLNLISNAIKFSSKDNRENPRVEVGCADKEEYYEFYVKDNGIGIDPRHHQEIFGIFKRLKAAIDYEGTGAGLSIVKRVIDDHGGKIWIESEVGKGATFYFTIPKILKEEGVVEGKEGESDKV